MPSESRPRTALPTRTAAPVPSGSREKVRVEPALNPGAGTLKRSDEVSSSGPAMAPADRMKSLPSRSKT